ncbi:uncharacterized protein LOC127800409 [Diospyros lotus]|uniref:uncharacterized protein LOC127800409 n=1 Tax=Diospyros lotus TaxID=55363 RepID=UPI002258489A|nr:uncharacterized protein LOC127800409 [Diospyros lotus]XP_052190960.1 uncharacterized protein LOC127800409 [Diospyros lotus]
MKTISGKVVSTKPISLSKAAKVLSNFVTIETGASQAVSAYLRRALVSFNELVQFHQELKGSKSNQKIKNNAAKRSKSQDPVKLMKNLKENDLVQDAEDSVGSGSAGKMHKMKKKKRKSGEVGDGETFDSVEQSNLTTKKKKRRRIEGED